MLGVLRSLLSKRMLRELAYLAARDYARRQLRQVQRYLQERGWGGPDEDSFTVRVEDLPRFAEDLVRAISHAARHG